MKFFGGGIIKLNEKKKTALNHKNYQNNKNFRDYQFCSDDELKKLPVEILLGMFIDKDLDIQKCAYRAFLTHSSWGSNFNIDRGIKKIIISLNLRLFEGTGLSYKLLKLNPSKIWASEDTLDYNKIQMVEAAMKYMVKNNLRISPVEVWKIKNSSIFNYVCHDGHHRIFIAHKMGIRIPAIILDYWLDNREDSVITKKVHYERIRTYVKDMPIEKFSYKS